MESQLATDVDKAGSLTFGWFNSLPIAKSLIVVSKVDFPIPLGPTIAIFDPGRIWNITSDNILFFTAGSLPLGDDMRNISQPSKVMRGQAKLYPVALSSPIEA
jgi:hypothetical protein